MSSLSDVVKIEQDSKLLLSLKLVFVLHTNFLSRVDIFSVNNVIIMQQLYDIKLLMHNSYNRYDAYIHKKFLSSVQILSEITGTFVLLAYIDCSIRLIKFMCFR